MGERRHRGCARPWTPRDIVQQVFEVERRQIPGGGWASRIPALELRGTAMFKADVEPVTTDEIEGTGHSEFEVRVVDQ
jgi:hypothetical protein